MTNSRQKIKVQFVENKDISQEELQRNWNLFLDIVLKKSISEKATPEVDQEKEID